MKGYAGDIHIPCPRKGTGCMHLLERERRNENAELNKGFFERSNVKDYNRAKKDSLQAMHSVSKPSQAQQRQLLYKITGVEITVELFQRLRNR